jgi:hypothetical protein
MLLSGGTTKAIAPQQAIKREAQTTGATRDGATRDGALCREHHKLPDLVARPLTFDKLILKRGCYKIGVGSPRPEETRPRSHSPSPDTPVRLGPS